MTDLQPIAAALDTEARFRNFLAGRPRVKEDGKSQYQAQHPDELQTQLNGLTDIVVLTVHRKDQLETDLRETKETLGRALDRIWVLGILFLLQGAVLAFVATHLFSRL